MESIKAEIRVTTQKVQPFSYKDGKGEMIGGESLEIRAVGFWTDTDGNHYPVSLHIACYPGHPVIPFIGDCIAVSVSRAISAS